MTRARCKLTYSGSPLKALSTHTEFAIKGLNHNVKQARVWQGAFHHNLQKLPLEIECRNDDNMKPASAPPPSKAYEILEQILKQETELGQGGRVEGGVDQHLCKLI